MAIRILFEGTVAKHVDSPDDNEDAYRTASDRGRVVLSDGASESFDARNWARLLVERMTDQSPSGDVVEKCAEEYEGLHDPAVLSWSKAAAYERGSFATLLIAQDEPAQNVVSVDAIGDSLAVWVDDGVLLATTPYTRAEQFQAKPTLLATRQELNALGDDNAWSRVQWAYEAQGYRMLLCMTDALGAWLLAHVEQGNESALETLLSIREQHELIDLVEVERAAGRLRRDDSTLIIASVTQS